MLETTKCQYCKKEFPTGTNTLEYVEHVQACKELCAETTRKESLEELETKYQQRQ